MKNYILAEEYDGQFRPTELNDDLDNILNNLEYGDVYEGNYQLWEFPSGAMSRIEPDRKVSDKYYYSTPSKDIWLPILIELAPDKRKVNEAYRQLIQH
jgi:hypothetical protein